MPDRAPLTAALAALALICLPAGAARATDTTVATVARSTPVAASDGHVVYSAWDGTQYRLTDLTGGAAHVLAGSPVPFAADLGPGPDGHELAVYPRCGDATSGTGCDLYVTDLVTGVERRLDGADSASDEISGAVWRGTLVFTRVYGRGTSRHGVVYRRPVAGSGRSVQVARRLARSLDLRGTRIPYVHSLEWSNEPWLLSLRDRSARRLELVPGSGAAVDFDDTLGPTAYGASTYWMLAVGGDDNVSEIHRFDGTSGRDERVPTRIPATATGFSFDGAAAYYAVPAAGANCGAAADCATAIHRADDLTWEPGPALHVH